MGLEHHKTQANMLKYRVMFFSFSDNFFTNFSEFFQVFWLLIDDKWSI